MGCFHVAICVRKTKTSSNAFANTHRHTYIHTYSHTTKLARSLADVEGMRGVPCAVLINVGRPLQAAALLLLLLLPA